MKKTVRCFKSRENANRVLFYFYSLARMDRKEETKQALHEGDTDTGHPFLRMVLRVLLL